MSAERKPCGGCGATGTVKRDRRRLADGTIDPLDFRREELCPSCGGAGSLPATPPRAAPDRGSGWIADHIHI